MESKQKIASVVLTRLLKVLGFYNGIRILSLVKSWDNSLCLLCDFFIRCFQVSEGVISCVCVSVRSLD